jgi:hypothetical protein
VELGVATGSWDVSYERTRRSPSATADLTRAAEERRAALGEATEFARMARLRYVGTFTAALRALDGRRAAKSGLLPERGYAEPSHCLLDAAASAWVFGGMGSWNDVYFDDERLAGDHRRISAALWDAVLQAIQAATNTGR